MKNKAMLYIKHTFLLAIGNKMRFILTLLGVLIGILIFSTGNLLLNSYYESKLTEINQMPENAFYTLYYGEQDSEVTSALMFALKDQPPLMEKVASAEKIIMKRSYLDGSELYIQARMHGISQVSDTVITYMGIYGGNMMEVNIKEGRRLTEQEISGNAKVCMIDEYGACLLFGNSKNAVGNYIVFNYYMDGGGVAEQEVVAYQVVGVIENQYYALKQQRAAQEEQEKGQDISKYVSMNIYCPYGFDEYLADLIPDRVYYVWKSEPADKENAMALAETACRSLQYKAHNVIDVIDKNQELEWAAEELKPLRVAINAITAGLLMIAGISCMSIMFFAMKERTEEIGIRKAFGAPTFMLLLQFLLENLIISLAASVLAVACSVLIGYSAEAYIRENFLDDFQIYINSAVIIKPVLLGMAQGLLFVSIPSVWYSSKNVVDALKADD